MLTVLPTERLLLPPPSRTVRFEGEDLGVDVAFFVVDLDPGGGPAQTPVCIHASGRMVTDWLDGKGFA